ncbi:MAG: DNA cytosine methyltransferase [Cycloclasticus sp.]|nr:DNA cytosine methyltransferase [Cycloclasticus sp.]
MNKNWNLYAKKALKLVLKNNNLTTSELAERFIESGITETKASIDNKISRGTFSASFLYQCLYHLNNQNFNSDESLKLTGVLALPIKEGRQFFSQDKNIGFIRPQGSKVNHLKDNKVISLFTGTGGFDIGLEQAGFSTVACVEIDEHCRETLRHNKPEWVLLDKGDDRMPGDIRKITSKEILKAAKLKKGEAALVVGGAPCQPFSNIGLKKGKYDRKNGDLFLEFVRVIKGTAPKAFIFENVTGITQAKHAEVISYMQERFSDIGYKISYSIINAADYGVPQKRLRFIILGLKGTEAPLFPMPTHSKDLKRWSLFVDSLNQPPDYLPTVWKSVGQAFEELPDNYKERSDYKQMNVSELIRNRMELIGPGENFKVLPMHMRPDCWKSGKHLGHDTFGRLKSNEPSVTIRTAAYNPTKGKYIHPTENRGLDLIEMSVLQSFPLTWEFKCAKNKPITLKSGGAQIGNAVPPLLAKALGGALYVQLSHLE